MVKTEVANSESVFIVCWIAQPATVLLLDEVNACRQKQRRITYTDFKLLRIHFTLRRYNWQSVELCTDSRFFVVVLLGSLMIQSHWEFDIWLLSGSNSQQV